MADNYLNKTVLQYFYNRLKTVFATKTEIPSASDIQDVIDADKALTATGSIATKGYADEHGGKIDKIYLNNVEQYIDSTKSVYLEVATFDGEKLSGGNSYIQFVAVSDNVMEFTSGSEGQEPDVTITVSDDLAELDNSNAGFITNAVNNLLNYYTKTETYTKAEVNNLIGSISSLNILIVQTLPTEDISTTTIYFVPRTTSETQNVYDEYIYVNNAWEKIGSTEIDLSNYWSKTELTAITTAEIDEIMGS